MLDPKESITVENVVASASIGQEPGLQNLATDLENANYDPGHINDLRYRATNPSSTILVFRSGKIVCTGAKSIKKAHQSLEIAFEKFRTLQIQIKENPAISVQNVVSSADLDCELTLNAIAVGLGLENGEYEPEQFPGLVYRLREPKVVAILFGSGKQIITGRQEVKDIRHAIDTIVDHLERLSFLE